mgnify:FL=1
MEERVITNLLKDVKIPKMVKVRQKFERNRINKDDIPNVIFSQLENEKFSSLIKPGMKICITCGSRGISNIPLIIKTIADFCKNKGALPFVIPAMGSHGGATAQGQRDILTSLGVTEETIGCEIKSSMETVVVGHTVVGDIRPEEVEVRIDKNAYEADGIILCGRIKAHTAFRGEYESGLMKMMTIGLGKQEGAESCHKNGFKYMARLVPEFGRIIMKNAPILFGLAILENSFDETCRIIAMTPNEIDKHEPELLKESFQYLPKILIDECDVLIVDEFGKNISGEGMDPNVTGAFATEYASGGIKAQKRAVLRLTEETHGNAHGIGLADAVSRKLFDNMDFEITYPNSITSTVLDFSKVPVVMINDKETFQVCIKTCTEIDKEKVRIVRVKNTLDLEYIYVSEGMIEDIKKNPRLEICSEPEELVFDSYGNLNI